MCTVNMTQGQALKRSTQLGRGEWIKFWLGGRWGLGNPPLLCQEQLHVNQFPSSDFIRQKPSTDRIKSNPTGFNPCISQETALSPSGVPWMGQGHTASEQLEPRFVTWKVPGTCAGGTPGSNQGTLTHWNGEPDSSFGPKCFQR